MIDPAIWEVVHEHRADLLREAKSNRLARAARAERRSMLHRLRRRFSPEPMSEAPVEPLPLARGSGA